MGNKFGRFGGLIAWGTFLMLFGLLVAGVIIGASRLVGYLWKWFG
jgi:hypothetical protein